jgi:hypothetical protein
MDLYSVYRFCSAWPFLIISFFYALFAAIEFVSSAKKQSHPLALDLLYGNIKNLKAKTFLSSFVGLFICFLILFSSNQFVISLGCEDIRVMPEGTYCYYVKATNENGKTYTLPAKIEKILDTYEYDEGKTKTKTVYYINNVYFKNGGYLYFEDCYTDYDTAEIFLDQRDRDWKIKITPYKAYHEKVLETNPNKPSKLILPFIEVIATLIGTVFYTINSTKTE